MRDTRKGFSNCPPCAEDERVSGQSVTAARRRGKPEGLEAGPASQTEMEKAKKPHRVEGGTLTAEGTAGPKLLWGGQNTPISFFSYPKVTRTDPVSELVPSQTLTSLRIQPWRRLLGFTRVTQMQWAT